MAVGDKIHGVLSLAVGAHLEIRPPVGQEWLIHNVYSDNGMLDFKVNTSGGTQYIWWANRDSFASSTNTKPTLASGLGIHCTNSQWLRITNQSDWAITILCGYDGIKTKE